MIVTKVCAEITIQLKGSNQTHTLIVFDEETEGRLAAFVSKTSASGLPDWQILKIPSELHKKEYLPTVFEKMRENGTEYLVQPRTT